MNGVAIGLHRRSPRMVGMLIKLKNGRGYAATDAISAKRDLIGDR